MNKIKNNPLIVAKKIILIIFHLYIKIIEY